MGERRNEGFVELVEREDRIIIDTLFLVQVSETINQDYYYG